MASYALNIVRALGYLTYGYFHQANIFTSSWVKAREQITDGDLVNYAKKHAQRVGIQKEVILIKGPYWGFAGTDALPGQPVITVPPETTLSEDKTKLRIISSVAHIRAGDALKWAVAPAMLAYATHWLFRSRSPARAAMAELAVGTTSMVGLMFNHIYARDKVASAVLAKEKAET